MNDQLNSRNEDSSDLEFPSDLELQLAQTAHSIEVLTTSIDWSQIDYRLDQRRKRKRRRQYLRNSGLVVVAIFCGLGICFFAQTRLQNHDQVADQMQPPTNRSNIASDINRTEPVVSNNTETANNEFSDGFDREQLENYLAKIRAVNEAITHLHTMSALEQQLKTEERAFYQSVRKRMSTDYLVTYSDSL